MTVAEWLKGEGAHHDLVEWASAHGDDWDALWRACPRGDWLLGIAARRGVDRRALVEAACACAALAFDHLPEAETRPQAAVEAARAWVAGADDEAARARASADVDAAIEGAPDPAVAAAATAALACLGAIDDPSEAATAAASAIHAAALDAVDCGLGSAVRYAQAETADRVRAVFPAPPSDQSDAVQSNG
ncbi:MAG: hypothetical protein VYE22_04195 [Myxococcota bacterium]|nr:hypothetical protein [Myxococcota bacterium]